MGLSRAYRAAVARQAGPIDLRAVADVTVAQMARLLHVYPDTVNRAIRRGDLETDPVCHPTRIPAAAARAYLAAHGVTSDRQEDLLRPAAAATARGVSTGTLARSAGPRAAASDPDPWWSPPLPGLTAMSCATHPAHRDVAPVPRWLPVFDQLSDLEVSDAQNTNCPEWAG